MTAPEKWLDAAALDEREKFVHSLDKNDRMALITQARAALTLRDEARRYYNADGSFVVMESPEAVVDARKAAAVELDECRAKLATAVANAESSDHAQQQAEQESKALRAKLAQAEQSVKSCYVCGEETSTWSGHALKERAETAERDLAAAQAENVRLREFLHRGYCNNCTYERGYLEAVHQTLSTPLGSRAALREMLTKAVHETDANPHEDPEAIVARLLGGGK